MEREGNSGCSGWPCLHRRALERLLMAPFGGWKETRGLPGGGWAASVPLGQAGKRLRSGGVLPWKRVTESVGGMVQAGQP